MTLSKKEYLEYVKGDISASRKLEIDQYLQDHPLEKKSLEAAIEHNKVNSFEDLIDLLDDRIDQRVITAEKTEAIDITAPPKGNVLRLWPYVTSAAAAAALIVFFVLPSLSDSKIQTATYFDAYPDAISATVRGENPPSKDQVLLALVAYNQNNYNKAAEMLGSAIENNSIDQRLPFYYAISLVGAENYKDALPILEELSKDPAFPYMDGVIWNLALCQIEVDQKAAAKETLNLVLVNNVYKKKEAQELLGKL